ncbi:MAG: hypothetical protein GX096_08285 [Clostridiales bacterium]|nr:hypothetical protein [Clostridiales bacterium]
MKKLVLLLAVLLLLPITAAFALDDDQLLSFYLPDGVQYTTLFESEFVSPAGLEGMYELMHDANSLSTIYLFRPTNGRALTSISSTILYDHLTAEQLLETWPLISAYIEPSVQYINQDAACASVVPRFGFDTLQIDTDIATGQEDVVMLTAQCNAFFRGDELLEIWTVYPTTYLYDEAAAAELQSDLIELNTLVNDFSFGTDEQSGLAVLGAPGGIPISFTSPNLPYALDVPAGSYVLTSATSQDDVTALRWEFTAAYGTAGTRIFDRWYADMLSGQAVQIITPDLSTSITLIALSSEEYAGLSLPELSASLLEGIPAMDVLYDSFTLSGDPSTLFIGEQEFIRLDSAIQLDSLAMGAVSFITVLEPDVLCEIAVSTINSGETYDIDPVIIDLIINTLSQTP